MRTVWIRIPPTLPRVDKITKCATTHNRYIDGNHMRMVWIKSADVWAADLTAIQLIYAAVVELVYTQDLKSCA